MQRRSGAEKIENHISGLIKDAAIEVHKVLGGPGLLESVYEEALCSISKALLSYYRSPHFAMKPGFIRSYNWSMVISSTKRTLGESLPHLDLITKIKAIASLP